MGLGLNEAGEGAEDSNQAGSEVPGFSVEAWSVRSVEGKNIALYFNLSLNCTYRICIYMM